MDSKSPNIVVLILTYNQREKTLACLTELSNNKDIPFRVLVWDNGSNDQTIPAIQKSFPTVLTYSSETNLGVAGGRNASAQVAIRELGATHLLFLDNDILVETGFVSALYEPFLADPRVGQTQAKLRFMHDRRLINDGGGAKISFVFWQVTPVGFNQPDQGQYDLPHDCISCGGAMMVRVDIFQQLGGFDPLFGPFGPEDLDFSLRLQKQGYRATYSPKAVGYHEVSHTYGKGYSEDYARHKSRHWMSFMRRHATLTQKAGFYFVGAPILFLRVVVREGKKGNWGAVRGLLQGIVKRKI